MVTITSITGRDLINQSMKMAGILGLGQTLNAEDINDGLTNFQNMVWQWQKRRWLVPSLFDISMPGNNEKSNKIGDGQYWNTPRPDKVRAAYFINSSGGLSSPVSFPLYPIYSYDDYSRVSLKELNSWPKYYFYDGAFPYANVFIWPIPNPQYIVHLIIGSQLGFSTTVVAGAITVAGVGYTDGVYLAVPLINLVAAQNGISATANVTVAGGIVTAFAIQSGGEFYKVGDTVTLDTAIVGAGTGFIYTVQQTSSSLDSLMEVPPEYLEAMIYNLAVRLCAMYQMEPSAMVQKIARTSLKTISAANAQVPELMIPGAFASRSRSTGIVNADGGVVWSDVA